MGLNASHKNARNIIVNPLGYDGNLETINNIPGLILNLDATLGITKDGSDGVDIWEDQSSEQNHLLTVSSTKPTYQEDVWNGLPGIRFYDQWMEFTNEFYPEEQTVFHVYKKDAENVTVHGINSGNTTTGSVVNPMAFYDSWNTNLVYITNQYHYRILSAKRNIGTRLSIDCVKLTNENLSSFVKRAWRGGWRRTPVNTGAISYPDEYSIVGSNATKGHHFQILIYDRLLTDEEIEQVHVYLNEKWGDSMRHDRDIEEKQYTAQTALNKADQLQLRADPYYETESFTDDFITGRSTVDRQLGDWNWNMTFIGNGSCTFLPSEINHPGIIELNVDGGESSLSQAKVTRIVPNMVFETQLKFPIATNQGITRPFWGIGNSYRGSWEIQTRAVGFRISNNIETNLNPFCRDAAGTTAINLPGILSSGIWYNFRWEYDGTTVFFYIDEVYSIDRNNYTKVFECTTNIPTGEDLQQTIGISGPAGVSMQCDYVHIEHQVIK